MEPTSDIIASPDRLGGKLSFFFRLVTVVPDFMLAGTALVAWVRPDLLPPRAIPWILMVMLLEFIVIHSNVLLGMALLRPIPVSRRLLILLLGGLLYSIFAGAFSLAMKSWWPIVSFWILMLNRMLHVLLIQGTTEFERKMMQTTWGMAVMAYVRTTFITVLLPVPALGITRDIVSTLELPGSGHWIGKPWSVVSMCFMYFTFMGLFDLFWAEKMASRLNIEKGKYRYR